MQQELLAIVNSNNAGDELGMEIRRLRDEKQASRQDMKVRMDEMMSFLDDLPCELTKYEEQYLRALLEKIIVYDEYTIIEFKSGIEMLRERLIYNVSRISSIILFLNSLPLSV